MVVARREFAALAWTATLWGAVALVAFLTGSVAGIAVLVPGGPAELRTVAAAAGWAMLLAAPVLSLRPTTEERRTGFWEVLATSPAPPSALVAGRFLAGLTAVTVIALVGLGAPFAVLETLSRPDAAHAACVTLGVVLIGGLYLASGLLVGLIVESAAVAFLAVFFFWAIFLIAVRSVAPALPASAADVLYGADPVRRLETFLDGQLDTASVMYFVGATFAFLFVSIEVHSRLAERAASGWRLRNWGGPLLAGAGAVALASGAVAIVSVSGLRVQLDATKTRGWEIDPPNAALFAGLGQEWQVTWIAPPTSLDPGIRAQVAEILAAIDAHHPGAEPLIRTIDPITSEGAGAYSQWLAGLVQRKRPDAAAAREAVESALEEIDGIVPLAASAAEDLTKVAAAFPEGSPELAELAQSAGALRGLAAGGPMLAAQIRRALIDNSASTSSEWSNSAALLALNHRDWIHQLGALCGWLAKMELDDRQAVALRECAANVRPSLIARARKFARTLEALESIGPDPLSEAASALAIGGAIVIESPSGVAVVSESQLGVGSGDSEAAVRFDRRFRIEQLIAAAARSIIDAQKPHVVIVHAEPKSVLLPSNDGSDCAGIADSLRAARIFVSEWRVQDGPRPVVPPTSAWMVLPPRSWAIEQDASERALLEAATTLAIEGRPLLLSVGPSLRPMSGRIDPWADLAARLGARVQSDSVIVEDVPVGEGVTQRRTSIEPQVADVDTPLSDALAGERVMLPVAVPVVANHPGGSQCEALLVSRSRPGRRLERDWRRRNDARGVSGEDAPDLSVAVTLERTLPGGERVRALVVGSPNWMMTATTDATRSLGGGREALLTPGNRDLAVVGALWLTGMDARISPGGAGRETARIPAISVETRLNWTALLALGVPTSALVVGGLVLLWRRRS